MLASRLQLFHNCLHRQKQIPTALCKHLQRPLSALAMQTQTQPSPHIQRIQDDDEEVEQPSQLGVRSNLPPDTPPQPNKRDTHLSDQEWEVRTGRAIFVLQRTLPDFFESGIVTSVEKSSGAPPSFPENANPLNPWAYNDKHREEIYSPKILMSYTPPVQLPAPFPKTLQIEGLPIYMALSSFVRHTLKTLYSDLQLTLTKVVVSSPDTSLNNAASVPSRSRKPSRRDKSVVVGFHVTGISRVSGAHGEWEVNSTYLFSPRSGLIDRHLVDSIYPAPHQAVYDSLRLNLGRVFGFGLGEGPSTGAGRATCSNNDREREQNG